jgi:hypothetical protein
MGGGGLLCVRRGVECGERRLTAVLRPVLDSKIRSENFFRIRGRIISRVTWVISMQAEILRRFAYFRAHAKVISIAR